MLHIKTGWASVTEYLLKIVTIEPLYHFKDLVIYESINSQIFQQESVERRKQQIRDLILLFHAQNQSPLTFRLYIHIELLAVSFGSLHMKLIIQILSISTAAPADTRVQ